MNKVIVGLLIILFFGTLFAQENEFNSALNLYKSGKSDEALRTFYKVVENYKLNPKTFAAKYFIAKILIDQTKYSQAEREINRFLEKNTSSNYVNDFLYLKVKLNYDQLKYSDAFKEAVKLVENSSTSEDKFEFKSFTQNIALNHLTSKQIKPFSDEAKDRKLKPFLLLVLGKKYLLENDNVNAIRSFNEITSSYSSSDEFKEAERLKTNSSTISSYGDKGILIGVMLPLNDNDGKQNLAGQEILEGIKYAISEHNKGRENKIGILIRDTRSRKENITAIKEEFVNNSSVRCIIGPIFSDEVRIALNEFRDVDLPMISPTATDEDLTDISSNFFQTNPPFSIRGRIFAQYLFYVENKRRMAILNAIEGYSPLLASNFVDEFEKLGGEIVVRESYRSNSFDLSEQIKNIASQSSTIEGIYIPLADKIDATAILSQLVQHSLNLPIYGNQDWMLVKGFETSPDLSNKLVFTSDYFIDFNDKIFKDFTEAFQDVTGKEVNRNILYGYDTAKYLLTAMRNIDPTRKAIKLKMESGISSVGFKNNISFDQSRMNKFLNIVRYSDGIFLLVDKFRAGR
ncbi:MAG: ABC transporter substrate-binding protein [Ignavibacteriaceae bacterium]|nr:ABC transporter substrate-binding protein [Ignavibacteriaceae bacterium]